MTKSRKIGIAGGIGAGKSIVCRVLEAMGYDVYQTDLWAKYLMSNDADLKTQLRARFGNEIYSELGILNTVTLSSKVFCDKSALAHLNALVHPRVSQHFDEWASERRLCFVESAIFYVSGLYRHVNEIWMVTSPQQLRLQRVLKRNPSLSEHDVINRISSQALEASQLETTGIPILRLVNDDIVPLLPQINKSINQLTKI